MTICAYICLSSEIPRQRSLTGCHAVFQGATAMPFKMLVPCHSFFIECPFFSFFYMLCFFWSLLKCHLFRDIFNDHIFCSRSSSHFLSLFYISLHHLSTCLLLVAFNLFVTCCLCLLLECKLHCRQDLYIKQGFN